ncbi:MAG TPA: Holliday junction branch migration DNA helicase RuvB [Acidimicrobiales bacterium]|nr:Holliday junction branch migration DNA helicase RuvB [Acidimicrobiales bacterium]
MSPRKEVIRESGVDEDALANLPPTAERPLDPGADDVEAALEVGLRPRRLADFVGQADLRERLAIVLEAARKRDQPVDHLLFAGPPGLGKTTLAGIVAAEMGASFRVTSGPALVRTGDVAAILTDLQAGDILFIDEIHRLGRAVEEVLYPAMEDFQLDIVLGKGPTARSLRLDIPRFTLVGATTRTGLVTGPLRDRFGFVARLDHYRPEELEEIVHRSARLLATELTAEGAAEIASRSRGTPRLAIRLLRRVRDFVEVRGEGVVTYGAAREGLETFGIDELGLDRVDRMILEALCRSAGRPMGLSQLAVSVGEEPETVEDAYEPFLLKTGLVLRTPRGRLATPAAFHHLDLPVPSHLELDGAVGADLLHGRAARGRGRHVPDSPSLFDPVSEERPCP